MKYENVQKAVDLKNAIDVTNIVIKYFKEIRDDKTEALHLYGNRTLRTNLGYETVHGGIKQAICDLIIKDQECRLDGYRRVLEYLD